MSDYDGVTDVIDLSGNGKGVALNVYPEPDIEVIDDVAYIPTHLQVGAAPANTRYEMNSGGLPAFDANIVQISSHDGTSLLELFDFYNDAKPAIIQVGKNRGDGNPSSANYSKKTLSGDRLFLFGFYGGKDASSTQTAFAHAGYITVTAEADNNGGNEQDSMISITPGYSSGAQGVGLRLNSKSQMLVPGPHTAYGVAGTDFGAIFKIGAGSATIVPLRFTPAALITAPVEGAIELDTTGVFNITKGLTAGTLSRRVIFAIQDRPLLSIASPAGTATLTNGPGWAKVVLTVGAADYTTAGAFVTLTFLPVFETIPVVVGSRDVAAPSTTTPGEAIHEWAFLGKATNRIQIAMLNGTLLANNVYVFNLLWFVP